MNSTEKLNMQVEEESDGSAVVSLPEGDAPVHQEHTTEEHDDGDDSRDNVPESDPAREQIRLARREERHLKKKLTRAKTQESNHLINNLKRQNEHMAERLAVLEKRTAGSDLARLDKAIEDAHVKLHYAKMKMKEATELADGMALAEAKTTGMIPTVGIWTAKSLPVSINLSSPKDGIRKRPITGMS